MIDPHDEMMEEIIFPTLDEHDYDDPEGLDWSEAEAEAQLAQYDDDPNPYNGTYSEE